MPIPLRKPLAALLVLIAAGCAPAAKNEPETTQVVAVSAATRQEAIAKITEMLKEKPEQRVYNLPEGHGWIEEYKLIRVEDMGVRPLDRKKAGEKTTQITCRITWTVTRWKTYGKKIKGEPTVRERVSTRQYNF